MGALGMILGAALHSRDARATAAARLARLRCSPAAAWRSRCSVSRRSASISCRSSSRWARSCSARPRWWLRRARAAAPHALLDLELFRLATYRAGVRRRLAVSHRYRRDAVPAAVDAAARVRAEPGGVGPADVRLGDGRHIHEDARRPHAESSWLQARAALECAARLGAALCIRAVPADDTASSSSSRRCSSAAVAVRCSSRA